MTYYLCENPFETDEVQFLINKSFENCNTTELIYAKKMMLLKVTAAKNVCFLTIGFLIMSLNFNIFSAMIVSIIKNEDVSTSPPWDIFGLWVLAHFELYQIFMSQIV